MSVQQISSSDNRLILTQNERILLEVNSTVPAGGGILYLTDQRFVFIGKKSLSSGLSIPSGVFGLIAFPIIAIANLFRRSKGRDIIEFELPYESISNHRIVGRLNKALEITIGTETIEFSMHSSIVENADRILSEQRMVQRDSREYSIPTSVYTSQNREQKIVTREPIDHSKIANELTELNIRYEVGDYSIDEYRQRRTAIENQLPTFSENDLDEIRLRLEIGEINQGDFIKITGRPVDDIDLSLHSSL